MSAHVTTLRIYLSVDETQSISDALAGLPEYCATSFSEHAKGCWSGEFPVSCPVAPHLAAGDFVDDLAPYFPQLHGLKSFYDAIFELEIGVGKPAPDNFKLESHLVAMLASLGASIEVKANDAIESVVTR
jgi:hypothetical protein